MSDNKKYISVVATVNEFNVRQSNLSKIFHFSYIEEARQILIKYQMLTLISYGIFYSLTNVHSFCYYVIQILLLVLDKILHFTSITTFKFFILIFGPILLMELSTETVTWILFKKEVDMILL